jgi:hypothetical protein
VIEWFSIRLVESFFVFRGKGYIKIDEWLRLCGADGVYKAADAIPDDFALGTVR